MPRNSRVPVGERTTRDVVGSGPGAGAAASDPGIAVRFDGVTKRYGAVTAVDAVSFAVAAGEMFGLIGPDGAGKTTTIRLMGGLLKPDAGRIRIFDRDPVGEHRATTADG